MDAERDSSHVYFLSCSFETTAPFTRRRTRNYYTEWYVIFAFLCRALQPVHKLTQIISQWFYTPDLSNQTFQREIPGRFGICVTPPGPGGRRRDCVYVCLFDIWAMNKNQESPSGETDDFLTWATLYDSIEAQGSTWTNSALYIEPSDVLDQWHGVLAAAVRVALVADPVGSQKLGPLHQVSLLEMQTTSAHFIWMHTL